MMIPCSPREALERIFRAGLRRADPYRMLLEHVHLDDNRLTIQFTGAERRFDLAEFERIYVLGAGKASARMAEAIEAILGERITGGVIAVKYGHAASLSRIRQIEAGHPLPDENSLRAAGEMIALARAFDPRTLVINLVSGGGSALCDGLLEFVDEGRSLPLTLDDLRATTQALLACGASIDELNCIRKHLSTVKGGRLVGRLYPATAVNLILSDVIGDRLDVIASGLTVPDESTFADALAVIAKYDLAAQIPARVQRALALGAAGQIAETPKPGDPVFSRTHNLLIGTLYHSLLAAGAEAEALGFHVSLLSAQMTGEARELARCLLGLARDVPRHGLLAQPPACLIAGGETTVTLRGSGKGGRNQEMALALLCELHRDPLSAARIHFLAASTDGSDGPTDAAGAFASAELYQAALARGLKPEEYLKNNDSYHLFEAIAGLLKTGPTGTNVCDLQILLIL